MLNVRFISDLHLEFLNKEQIDGLVVKLRNAPPSEILILAGDICVIGEPDEEVRWLYFLAELEDHYPVIIWIPGNHEYYYNGYFGTLEATDDFVRETLLKIGSKVKYLNKETFVYKDLAFHCAALWTDFDRENPVCMNVCHNSMADYTVIRHNGVFNPHNALDIHYRHKDFIFEACHHYPNNFVVTHHGCSWNSVHPRFQNRLSRDMNGGFVSELSENILRNQKLGSNISYWVHGHVHNSFDYWIGSTNVITNPMGYGVENKKEFDPELTIAVPTF